MTIRPFTAHDYPTLVQWWDGHGMPAIPPHAIPPFSWIVEATGPAAFAAAYMDNGGTGVALITWITTNPENRRRESYHALESLLPFMRDHLAKQLDYTVQLSLTNQPGLEKLLIRMGFKPAGTGYTEHIYCHGT